MTIKINIGIAGLALLGLIIFPFGCIESEETAGIHRTQTPLSSRGDSHQQSQQIKLQTDDMIRRVNSIIENIGSVDERIQEAGTNIFEEKDMLDKIKQNAKTAYLGGQIADFRMWQRIGRDKMTNIEITLQRLKNTIHAACQDAASELRQINWISNEEKNMQQSQVNQKLLELDGWMTKIGRVVADLSLQHTWLNENE